MRFLLPFYLWNAALIALVTLLSSLLSGYGVSPQSGIKFVLGSNVSPPNVLSLLSASESRGSDTWAAIALLEELDYQNYLRFSKLPAPTGGSDKPDGRMIDLNEWDAVFVREAMVAGLVRNLSGLPRDCIVSLPSTKKLPPDVSGVLGSVQHCLGYGTADSVADLIVWYALESHRPIAASAYEMSKKASDATKDVFFQFRTIADLETSRGLRGSVWGCIGAGREIQCLIPRLQALGVDEFHVYHCERDSFFTTHNPGIVSINETPDWVKSALDAILPSALFSQDVSVIGNLSIMLESTYQLTVMFRQSRGRTSKIHFHVYQESDPSAEFLNLNQCDFVSLHLGESGRSVVNDDFLKQLQNGVFLINTSSAANWDVGAVSGALRSFGGKGPPRLRGVASDVFHPKIEAERFVPGELLSEVVGIGAKPCPFYGRGFSSLNYGIADVLPKVILTPGIASQTQELDALAAEVVGRTLLALFNHQKFQASVNDTIVCEWLKKLVDAIPASCRWASESGRRNDLNTKQGLLDFFRPL